MGSSIKLIMKNYIMDNQGFTLVEIIAVLVMLGILAAVALPKYMKLSETARTKSAMAAIAEGITRCNQAFAKQLLAGTTPTNGTILTAVTGSSTGTGTKDDDLFNSNSDLADYDGSFSIKDDTITITVNKVQTKTITPIVKEWILPSS